MYSCSNISDLIIFIAPQYFLSKDSNYKAIGYLIVDQNEHSLFHLIQNTISGIHLCLEFLTHPLPSICCLPTMIGKQRYYHLILSNTTHVCLYHVKAKYYIALQDTTGFREDSYVNKPLLCTKNSSFYLQRIIQILKVIS